MRDILNPGSSAKKLAYTGIALMDRKVLDLIPTQKPSDFITLCLRIIRRGQGEIRGIVVNGYEWTDVGTIQNYLRIHRDILMHKKPLLSDFKAPPNGVFVDQDSIVEEGVRFRGFVSVGKRCLLKNGCTLEDAVLWDDVIIEQGTSIKKAIAGKNWCINAG
jgi:NDP-sugar pyrophosphorylase family protein